MKTLSVLRSKTARVVAVVGGIAASSIAAAQTSPHASAIEAAGASGSATVNVAVGIVIGIAAAVLGVGIVLALMRR